VGCYYELDMQLHVNVEDEKEILDFWWKFEEIP
jgi:hypothetical protein